MFRTKRRYAEEGLDEVLRLHNQVNRRTGSWTTGGEAQLIAPSLYPDSSSLAEYQDRLTVFPRQGGRSQTAPPCPPPSLW